MADCCHIGHHWRYGWTDPLDLHFDRRWSIMAIETKEITFEQEIEYSLLDHGGYIKGNPRDYNREFAIDTKQLFQFLLEVRSHL